MKKKARTTEYIPTEEEAVEMGKEIQVSEKKELILEGDPMEQLGFAQKASQALMTVVSQKKNPVMIRGEQYLEFGDWQTLARFFGATAAVEWTKPLTKKSDKTAFADDVVIGYEARAVVYHHGEIISSAEAMCLRDERNWKERDEFMLRSMAQTRACAKALRNAYGWVAELAGYKATPAEEMEGIERDKSKPIPASRVYSAPKTIRSLENPREKLKLLLQELGHNPKTVGEAEQDVMRLTGLDLNEYNTPEIFVKLQDRIAKLKPEPLQETLEEQFP